MSSTFILTNFGLRYVDELLKTDALARSQIEADTRLLLDIYTGLTTPDRDDDVHRDLIARGLIARVPDTLSHDDIDLRYRRNPLEHVERIIVEFTTCCNFNCAHCYNATVPRVIERDVAALSAAADLFLAIGARRFDFIGGEVSKYGTGWLDLARYIRARSTDSIIALYTNGWWLEQQNFWAAGHTYSDVSAYLSDLKASGVSHITFSLDGPGVEHDQSRHQPGLYGRILNGLAQVRTAGLQPRVSLLARGLEPYSPRFIVWLAEIADRVYGFPPETARSEKALRLFEDRTNSFSHFIDIGNGAACDESGQCLADISDDRLYCRGFFRPAPSLTIKANGEVALCRITNAGEGYGNLHERPLIDILNHLQEAFVFRLHAERRLADYRRFVDPEIFGNAIGHLCTYRAILTLLARRMHEEQIDPDDGAAIQRLNLEVARLTGHATGQAHGQNH
jgi:sulfatase maturation enzyme AslB (radical SAM superfamily)